MVNAVTRQDVLDDHWNARTRVHEYGGAAATLYDGTLYFSHFGDNRVYMKTKGSDVVSPITPGSFGQLLSQFTTKVAHGRLACLVQPTHRYADFTVHPVHTNLLVGICEDHTDPHPARIVSTLALINSSTGTVKTLV